MIDVHEGHGFLTNIAGPKFKSRQLYALVVGSYCFCSFEDA